ncbi:MAG TPA: dihydrofolate reductase family protein [Candidatus Limnocylindrales bacterium]
MAGVWWQITRGGGDPFLWTDDAADGRWQTGTVVRGLYLADTEATAERPGAGFTFVNGLDEALRQAREAAGDRDVNVMGGADLIRQALRAGHVEELSISIAPFVMGGGKRLFEGFDAPLRLEPIRVVQSPFATHITYRVFR